MKPVKPMGWILNPALFIAEILEVNMIDKSKWFVLRKMIKLLDVSGLSLFLILNLIRPIKCFVPKKVFLE
ncbi:hypothetical protein BANRA_00072 [Acinetobacter baumannii]|nr:hypothetical protein BANRA_00072 [Acinetobacter baumannii]